MGAAALSRPAFTRVSATSSLLAAAVAASTCGATCLSVSRRFCATGDQKATDGAAAVAPKEDPFVETSDTPNPDSLRFFSMTLSFLPQGHSMDFPSADHAYKSPLAEAIFALEGVESVYFADEYITVTKDNNTPWEMLKPMVGEAIIAFASSDKNILSDEGEAAVRVGNEDTEPQPGDTEVVLAIKELLASRIRPMLVADGGNLRFVAFDDGLVYVVLEGACKTCPSSGATLKHGIERMLMHWIPEVEEVVEVDELWAEDFQRTKREAEEKKAAEAAATAGATPSTPGPAEQPAPAAAAAAGPSAAQ
jgi:Fe-S cluster biogenesis protein NfuA